MRAGYWFMLFLLSALLSNFPQSAGAAPRTQEITILHTSDRHGELLPFDRIGWVLGEKDQPVGGFARQATLIKQLRRETKNPTITVDCGDLYQHGPWFFNHLGHPEIAALNATGYDLFCVGNHDLEYYPKLYELPNLLALVKESRFPWLSANLQKSDGTRFENIKPYTIKKMGTLRVGFLALTDTTSQHEFHEYLPEVKMQDAVEAAQYWVPIVRKQCDVLIALTHLGDWERPDFDFDSKVIAAVPGIDAVVGGHIHKYTEAPLWYKNPAGEGVPVVYPGEYGLALGKYDLTFQKTGEAWKLAKANYDLIPVSNKIAEDPGIKALLDTYAIRRPSLRSYAALKRTQDTALNCDLTSWRNLPEAMAFGQRAPLTLFKPNWQGPQDLSARAWAAWNEKYLYLTFDVTDDVFFQEQTEAKRVWFNDSIQLDIDPKGDRSPGAPDDDDREYYLALMGGKPVVYCALGPDWGERKDLPVAARKKADGKGWIYQIALPWSELGITPEVNTVLGLSWLVYDSDGGESSGWLQWTAGVSWNGLDPANYGVVTLTETPEMPAALDKYLKQ